MNALARNAWTAAWQRLGETLPRPRAILAISAHWYVRGSRVTSSELPRTIHDFGGFPRELFAVQYPAPGSPELAQRVIELLGPERVALDGSWGIDHGTWSVLVHLAPAADVPVVQLSVDTQLGAREHLALARGLRPLRDEGVLVLGSGNVVHNLRAYAWGNGAVEPHELGLRFEREIRARLERDDDAGVADYEQLGADAAFAAPTAEHYLPLLYVAAQRANDEPVSFPVEGFDGGSISMLALQVG